MVTGGGFDAGGAELSRSRTPPSRRRAIAARLQADWVYRPRTVLAALERCAELLAGHELQAYFLSAGLRAETERICALAGMRLRVISEPTLYAPHDEILAMHSRSRVSIAAAVADGTSLGSRPDRRRAGRRRGRRERGPDPAARSAARGPAAGDSLRPGARRPGQQVSLGRWTVTDLTGELCCP